MFSVPLETKRLDSKIGINKRSQFLTSGESWRLFIG
jgi:hypothetical protein